MDEQLINNQQAAGLQQIGEQEINRFNIDFDHMSKDMKTFDTGRTKEAIRGENQDIEQRRILNQNDYLCSKQAMYDRALQLKNDSELLLRDKKWTRFFFVSESDEMKKVKTTVAYLNKMLDGDVKLVDGVNGKKLLDTEHLSEKIIPAYQAAFDACDAYVEKYKGRVRKRSYGRRRFEKVKNMLSMLQEEKNNINIIIDNAKENRFSDVDWSKKTSMREVLGEIRVHKAVISTFVPEGNSSNTYRVRVKGEDGQYYYVKIDEKLLNENFNGYIDNRLEELQRSKNIKLHPELNGGASEEDIKRIEERVKNKEITEEEGDKLIIENRAKREELRLEGKIDLEDYDHAINFLTLMKNKLEGLTGADKEQKKNAFVSLFAHDYDKFFSNLADYNAQIHQLQGDKDRAEKLIETLENDKKQDNSKLVEALKNALQNGLKPMTELEWLKNAINKNPQAFGVSAANDPELFALLEQIGQKEGGLRKLFTRSLGKESELFGQQAERSGISSSDVLASNNTATSRLAQMFGFSDVVTTSFKGKLDFTQVGKTTSLPKNVTFSVEAPGAELLQIMQDAQKYQTENHIQESLVHFSPEAIRQMSRLQTCDLITLQTDRHWRNIKAKFHVVEGNPKRWVIDSIKSYDHDQSFGTNDLKDYFADEEDPVTHQKSTRMPGFLKPIMMTVSRSSKLYRYAKTQKMSNPAKAKNMFRNMNFMDAIEFPKPKCKEFEDAANYYKETYGHGKDQYTHMPWEKISRSALNMNWNNQYVRENIKEGAEKCCPGKGKLVEEFFKKFSQCTASLIKNDDVMGWHITDANFHDEMTDEERQDKIDEEKHELANRLKQRPDEPIDDWYNRIEDEEKKIELKYAKRVDVLKNLREAYALYQQLDLTNLEKSVKGMTSVSNFSGKDDVPGYYDYCIQCFFHMIKMKFENDNATRKAMADLEKLDIEEAKEEYREEVRLRVQVEKPNLKGKDLDREVDKQLNDLMKKETAPDVRMPAILHMDREAFLSVQSAIDSEVALEYMLKDLGMTKDKKDALKKRLIQIRDEALEAEQIVKKWAKDRGLPDDSIEAKFFLDADDYSKITKLTDMALDPGLSYFSNEDSQFMCGQEEMKSFLSEDDKKKAREITNHERNQARQKAGNLVGDYTSMVNNTILNNQAA